jgi:DNA polymerase
MEGFFTKKEIGTVNPDGRSYTCVSCGLFQTCNSPKMEAYGNFKKGILNIGEAPGRVEDKEGKPFQGKTGSLLNHVYKRLGIDLFEDCININAINCYPGEDHEPSNYEVDCCRRIVMKVIEKYKPKIIVVLGGAALYSIIGDRWSKDLTGITKWRGWTIPDQDLKTWIFPTFHPSFVARTNSKEVDTIWEQDLEQAIRTLHNNPFPVYVEPKITILKDLTPLNDITKGFVAIDYETTGIKPHGAGHKIISASVAVDENNVYAFLMPESRRELSPWINLLKNPNVSKMAHNMKFEEAWSVERLRTNVVPWVWDSMLASHLLDNRPGISGLKFQTYVQFGIIDYSSDTSPYLQAVDNTNANSINKIESLLKIPGGTERLLKYNALDSVFEYRLAMKQRVLILNDDLPF